MNASLHDTLSHAAAAPVASAFAFSGRGGGLLANGAQAPLRRGTAATLESRLARAFAQSGPQAIIGGAMPFRRDQADYLFCAEQAAMQAAPRGDLAPNSTPDRLRAEPSAQNYARSVSRALDLMRNEAALPDGLRKIVLARTLQVSTRDPIASDALMARLAEDDSVTAFRVTLPPLDGDIAPRSLVGATPELLLEKRGRMVLSYPLAGSARRSRDMGDDADASAALARSDKDRREHAMVVEYILDMLAPNCRRLDCPDGTRLTCTRSMWHLGTRIQGELKDDATPSAVLAARLHPTPAVCGLPCARAAELITRLEPVERDFYAGAVGWCDRQGDGAWYVAIRCAEICGMNARLYAGAGIVPGSDPQAEAAETGSKFAAMLRALGLPSDAALAPTE